MHKRGIELPHNQIARIYGFICLNPKMEIYSCVESRNVVISQMYQWPYTKCDAWIALLNSAPEYISREFDLLSGDVPVGVTTNL